MDDQEEVAAQSLRTLQMLEEWSNVRESMPPLPPPPRLPRISAPPLRPPPPPKRATMSLNPREKIATSREVRYKLADAWVLLTESQEAVRDWKRRANKELGLTAMDIRLRNAVDLVDELIFELEPPTDRSSKRPPK